MTESSGGAVLVIQDDERASGGAGTLFDGYRQFYRGANLDGARAFSPNGRARRIRTVPGLLDQDGEEIPAGLAQLYPSFSSASMQRLWILNDLYVAPEARKHGVGQALLQAAREHAERTRQRVGVDDRARQLRRAGALRIDGWQPRTRSSCPTRYTLLRASLDDSRWREG